MASNSHEMTNTTIWKKISKDTIRKNSKVGSSLNFTYIDENCEKVVDYDTKPEFPIEEVKSSPITPIVNVNYNVENY